MKKKTLSQFISEAESIHKDINGTPLYKYHLIKEYKNTKTKVTILCPVKGHGVFEQEVSSHLRGTKCPKCYHESKTMSQDLFINKSRDIHSDKYDYSQVVYKNNSTKVNIACPIHQVFTQRPSDHLNGRGCPKCAYDKKSLQHRMSVNEFIRRAKLVHGDKYDYSKVVYVNSGTKVIITCPEHGSFEQIPSDHLRESGCPKCYYMKSSKSKFMGRDEFVRKAKLKHNNRYSYNKVKYKGSTEKIIITCPVHGDYMQRAIIHLQGYGCSKCSSSKGETNIANYLDEHKIPYIREYRLDGYRYRYDFYLEGYNLLVEFHGIQHYNHINRWGGKKAFKKRVRHDKAKVELAKRNGIDLLVITYLEIEQIEDILKYELFTKSKNTKIVDISHVYGLYCSIDKGKNKLQRYHDIVYGYLKGHDLIKIISKYNKLNRRYVDINKLLSITLKQYKSIFIRLLVIENKLLIKQPISTVKAYKEGKILK